MTKQTIAIGGDSQTSTENAYGVEGYQNWGKQLEYGLRARGGNVRCRIFGVGGDDTGQLLTRLEDLTIYDIPWMAILYIGVNDPIHSLSQATTQANLQVMLKSLKHGAKGQGIGYGVSVATPSALPAGGELGQRYVVTTDPSTTGGAAAWHPSHTATIPGAGGSAMTVWEQRNGAAGELGWGRVATATTAPTVVKRILVMSTNYLNWTTGGDTPSTPYAANASVRVAQQAAVTAENVQIGGVDTVRYADLYTFERNRIVNGFDPNFSSDTAIVPTTAYDATRSWHAVQNDQHNNAYGHTNKAQVAQAAMPSAWLTEIGAS